MSRFFCGAALLGATVLMGTLSGKAQAQFGSVPNAPQGGVQGGTQGATFSLPPSVKTVVSIDAHNMLLAEVEEDDGSTNIVQLPVRHLYTGGIAQLFGGTAVPTGPFISPGYTKGFGGRSSGGVNSSSVGNQNGLNGGFNTGGLFNNGLVGGFNSGFGPNTTVTGTGIFAPSAQVRK